MGFTRKVVASTGQLEKSEKERLKREDHLRVKHDKLFSRWKILVGPSDWKNHAAGEEGSQRYRLHNLPAAYFGPGVYELGLTQHTDFPIQEPKQPKLSRAAVVVVYLGQADNVRQRLQRYGQTGSHLEGTRSGPALDEYISLQAGAAVMPANSKGFDLDQGSNETSIQGGLRLFTDVFSRGYSIAFRWARTESKQIAEKVEAELLHVFDYPWNTCLNGARRPRDILAKLEILQHHLERSLCLGRALGIGSRRWEYLGRKVGISVAVRKPLEKDSSSQARPKLSIFLTSTKPAEGDGPNSSVCGVLLEDGSVCCSPPAAGRRRCDVHKGLRIKPSTKRVQPRTPKTKVGGVTMVEPVTIVEASVVTITSQIKGKRVEVTKLSSTGVVCGVVVDGGSPCLNIPLKGRKHCTDHRGMRTTSRKPTPLLQKLGST